MLDGPLLLRHSQRTASLSLPGVTLCTYTHTHMHTQIEHRYTSIHKRKNAEFPDTHTHTHTRTHTSVGWFMNAVHTGTLAWIYTQNQTDRHPHRQALVVSTRCQHGATD